MLDQEDVFVIELPRIVAVTPDALGASFRASDGSEKNGLSHLKERSIAENGYNRFADQRKNVHIVVNAEKHDQVVFHAAIDDVNGDRIMLSLKHLGANTLLTSREDLYSLAKAHHLETFLGKRHDVFDSSSSEVSRDASSLDLQAHQEFHPIRIAFTPRTIQVDGETLHAATSALLENTSRQLLKYTAGAKKHIDGRERRVYENITKGIACPSS